MAASFDHIAHNYDDEFTSSLIGKAQRHLVFNGLFECFPSFQNLNILEINCGTGQDALKFGELGANVLATDISTKMVGIANQKTAHLPKVTCEVLDITLLDSFKPERKFDLIFSNFGGLNCLDSNELARYLAVAQNKLTTNGKLIMVIMPNFCLWESLYFTAKLQISKAFRRGSKSGVLANVDGNNVLTFYYSPNDIIRMATGLKPNFIQPIGFFIPPSYLNPFFHKRQKTLQKLKKFDEKMQKSKILASLSDHYLICLQKE
jgi:SAM-dependent methyltransferase